jgi:hypothetical protein
VCVLLRGSPLDPGHTRSRGQAGVLPVFAHDRSRITHKNPSGVLVQLHCRQGTQSMQRI